jgi:1,4-alpha-glucan branching enzyme
MSAIKTPSKVVRKEMPYGIAEIKQGRKTATVSEHPGMGAIPYEGGVAFRVWAPHATAVSVVGTFNNWDKAKHQLIRECDEGYWSNAVPGAKIGAEYRYILQTAAGELSRIDPYAREVTNSAGNGVVHDPHFDWEERYFKSPKWNELVIYELHVGTFNDEHPEQAVPAKFESIVRRFDHLKKLGVNCLQIMPVAEFAGNRSWGYNPAHIFAVESAYGGPRAFKEFVKAAHKNGFASFWTWCTTTLDHRTSISGALMAGARTTRAGSTFTRTGARTRRGATPDRTTDARRFASLFAITPSCGLRTTTLMAYVWI